MVRAGYMPFIFAGLLLTCKKPIPGIQVANCQLKKENYWIESIDEKTLKSNYVVDRWKAQIDFAVTNDSSQEIYLAKDYATMQLQKKNEGMAIRLEAVSHYEPPKEIVRLKPRELGKQSILVRTQEKPSFVVLRLQFSTDEAFQNLIWIESSMVKCRN